MSVAEIGIRVSLDNAASAGLNSVNSGLNNMTREAERTGRALDNMSLAQLAVSGVLVGSVVAFGAFAAAIKFAVDQASNIEQVMFKIKEATSATSDQMEALKPVLIGVANQSIFSLSDLGDAMVVMGQKGFSTGDMMSHLAMQVKNLAEAISTDPVNAANLLGTTMEEFQIPVANASQTVDLLQFAIEHGVPSIDKLIESLSKVGPSADQLHIPLSEVVSTLDVLGRNMGDTSDLGAIFQGVLTTFISPTTAASRALATLGISVVNNVPALHQFENALASTSKANADLVGASQGSVKGLNDMFTAAQKVGLVNKDVNFNVWAEQLGFVNNKLFDSKGNFNDLVTNLHLLKDSLDKLSPEEQANIIGKLFPRTASRGVDSLLNNIKELDNLMSGLNSTTNNHGKAADLAAQQEKTLSGASKALSTTFQSLAGILGGPLASNLASVLYSLNQAIAPILTLIQKNPELGASFLKIGLAVSSVVGLGGLIAASLVSPVVGSFLAVGGIILGTVAAILAISAAIMFMQTHWKQVMDVVNKVTPIIQGVGKVLALIGSLIAGISLPLLIIYMQELGATLLATAIPAITTFLSVAVPGFLTMAAATLSVFGPLLAIGLVIGVLIAGLVLLVHHFGLMNTIMALGKAVWASVSQAFSDLGNFFKANGFIKTFSDIWHQLVNAFNLAKPALMALGALLGFVLVVALGLVIGLLTGLIKGLAMFLSGIVVVIAGVATFITGLVQIFLGVFSLIHGIFTLNGAEIQKSLMQIATGIGNIFKGMFMAILGVIYAFVSGIASLIGGFVVGIITFFTHMADVLVHHSIIPDMLKSIHQWFSNILPSIIGVISSWIGNVVSTVSGIGPRIMSVLSGLGSQMLSWGSNAMHMFAQGLAQGIQAVLDQVNRATTAIAGFFGHHSPAQMGPLAHDDEWMPNMMKMHADGIRKGVPLVADATAIAAKSMSPTLAQNVTHGPTGIGGTRTINLMVDKKVLASVNMDILTGQLQMNGVGRLLQ